ncbi:DUF2529 domain-containing protein [Alkalihalobacillus oceani]|uniref:DUF2529 domain-containing protein n=1 Tax=Halalkalibacter oceani TaxID=1653776 RepID=A0A9X2DNL2_9BACI|nr:DUF2529 domain-containing protein [Halalkalibacter oceani]MCM3714236.1 DUF2529 domain-containing protein [Halalkalibacter oceani]
MLKIFTTQLNGLLKKIAEQEDEKLEDAARLLSQALVGDGHLYIYGKDEMTAVTAEALYGKERFEQAKPLTLSAVPSLTSADRVLLAASSADDPELLLLISKLYEHQVPCVLISGSENSDAPAPEQVDVHLPLPLRQGLVPTETGDRIGYPLSLAALYVYFCLSLLMRDILAEYE